jgi:hypothetical protein
MLSLTLLGVYVAFAVAYALDGFPTTDTPCEWPKPLHVDIEY